MGANEFKSSSRVWALSSTLGPIHLWPVAIHRLHISTQMARASRPMPHPCHSSWLWQGRAWTLGLCFRIRERNNGTGCSHFLKRLHSDPDTLKYCGSMCSHNGFSPDPISCKALVSAFVETKVERGWSVTGYNDLEGGFVGVLEGYELLRQVLIDGLVPESAAFNKLISGFCKEKQYTRVSKLLHTLIAKNRVPDNYMYHEV
ncbi:PREDICTED: pentatricopeptide repeat-containing [Prunus dulcis]|uniref:PREDICTED: pentatricopeptide repeat-containing n=1 Tax=Prunus dulcis TaxID=3755 RepID=A0A5E4GEJ8_PRUDU|nr:hypothetical protein L3X38_017217 [Prunus dulcis]VVA38184.1 PREDICTED: pentatricopeptide repeat-containing [Prunus dulcis]